MPAALRRKTARRCHGNGQKAVVEHVARTVFQQERKRNALERVAAPQHVAVARMRNAQHAAHFGRKGAHRLHLAVVYRFETVGHAVGRHAAVFVDERMQRVLVYLGEFSQ